MKHFYPEEWRLNATSLTKLFYCGAFCGLTLLLSSTASPVQAQGLYEANNSNNAGYSNGGGYAEGNYGAETAYSDAPYADIPASPPKWNTSMRVWGRTSITFSDNIDLNNKGAEEEGLVGTASAGIGLGVQNQRINGSLNYQISYDHDFEKDLNRDFRHNLAGYGEAAIIPNLLYVDAQGSIAETYHDDNARFSGNSSSGRSDRERVYYGSISPSLRKNLGGWANAELRYRHSRTYFDDERYADNASNVYSASLSADTAQGSRLGWSLHGAYTDSREKNREAIGHWNGAVSVAVPLSVSTALTASVGYDRYDNIKYDDELDGVYGNIGLQLAPSERFQASGHIGYRYNGLDYGLGLNYALAEQLSIAISAGRTVEFSDYGGAPVRLFGAGVDKNGKPLFKGANGGVTTNIQEALAINQITGVQGRFGSSAVNDLDSTAIIDSLTVALAGATYRTTYGGALIAQQRDYGDLAPKERSFSGSIYGSYDVTDRISLDADLGLANYHSDAGVDHNTLSIGIGTSVRITEIINAFARYSYTERFADKSSEEYRENAITVGVHAEF